MENVIAKSDFGIEHLGFILHAILRNLGVDLEVGVTHEHQGTIFLILEQP